MSFTHIRIVGIIVIALLWGSPLAGVAMQSGSATGLVPTGSCVVAPLRLTDLLELQPGADDTAPNFDDIRAATPVNPDADGAGRIVAAAANGDEVAQTVADIFACWSAGDALRYYAHFSDDFIARQFETGALTDAALLDFGQEATKSARQLVAVQTTSPLENGHVSAIVVSTEQPIPGASTDEGAVLVDTYLLTLGAGGWSVQDIRPVVTFPIAAITDGPLPTGGDVPGPPVEAVELSAPGIAWSIYEITIPQGGTINLFNDGSGGQHNFAVEGYNDAAPVDMPIGETVAWTVPADLAPGTYTFYCAIPGHRALMEGTITIT